MTKRSVDIEYAYIIRPPLAKEAAQWYPPAVRGRRSPMRPVENSVPQAGCIQPAIVRYQRLLANTRVLACLNMYELTTVLRTRPPVGEEGEQVVDADVAVTVEVVLGAARLVGDADLQRCR